MAISESQSSKKTWKPTKWTSFPKVKRGVLQPSCTCNVFWAGPRSWSHLGRGHRSVRQSLSLCLWPNRVVRASSLPPQAPVGLVTERLCKCGQTDEAHLPAPPPKGTLTFSGDNIGLQWHRKHSFPKTFCSSVLFLCQLTLPLPPLISSVLSAAATAFYLLILLQVKRLDKVPKAWWQGRERKNIWLDSTKENDCRQKKHSTIEYSLGTKSFWALLPEQARWHAKKKGLSTTSTYFQGSKEQEHLNDLEQMYCIWAS